jgi:hypothetical protein
MLDYRGLQLKEVSRASVRDYAALLSSSFVGFQPTVEYLDWLYFENPRGKVRGFDAFNGDMLVAHYACIPIKINGYKHDSLLSLNTATHPNFQGRGLFSTLATKTFESVSASHANVIGVANAKSIGGFIKYLGFEVLGNLELRLGSLSRSIYGSRVYSKDELRWRTSCPGRILTISDLGMNSSLISIRPRKLVPKLKAIVTEFPLCNNVDVKSGLGLTLDWRRGMNPLVKLPKFLKPSPLVLIFKPLLEGESEILSSFSFPDFDAF